MKRSKVFYSLLGAALALGGITAVQADFTFRHTVTGEVLDMEYALEEGRDTPAVKTFMETGTNPYNEVKSCLPAGEEMFLTACSGCHGHLGEGKIGPGLNDDYWTYPKNETDKGLFETIYGGAQGQMGPHYGHMTLDEMLLTMAWIRHLYVGPTDNAPWLTPEQKADFTPYSAETAHAAAGGGDGATTCSLASNEGQ